jgi:hypothetical protein
LPPGWSRRVTIPSLIGSSPIWKTIGMVVVADFAAGGPGLPDVNIAATWRWCRQRRQPFQPVLRPTIFNRDVAPLDEATLAQARAKCRDAACASLLRTGGEIANHRNGRLLRPRPHWPQRRTAQPCDELPPSHLRPPEICRQAYSHPGCIGTGADDCSWPFCDLTARGWQVRSWG